MVRAVRLSLAVTLLAAVAVLVPVGSQTAAAQTVMWEQVGADIDGEAAGDVSGSSVAMSSDGGAVIIGARGNDGNGTDAGHARVFDWNGVAWVQRGADIDGEAAGDRFGSAVAMSGDGTTVVIGAPEESFSGVGYARVFDWDGAAWVQRGVDIDGEAAGDRSGSSVAISSDADTVVVGAPQGASSGAGYVRIYDWDGTAWVQRGSDVDGAVPGGTFGDAVAISSDATSVFIGAPRSDNGNGTMAGLAGVFDWDGAAWVQRGADIDGVGPGDLAGISVAMSSDGNTVMLGAPRSGGEARVYDWDGAGWVQRGTDIERMVNDDSNVSVAMSSDGNTVALGVNGSAGPGTDAGYVWVHDWDGAAWVQRGTDIDGEAPGDLSQQVAMSSDGNTVVIGAIGNDGNGSFAGHARVYRFAEPCQPGSFSTTGAEPCTPAPAGFFVDTTGATSATPCPVGTFQAGTGATGCDDAPAGFFVDVTGATSATPCPVGTFQAGTGATGCDDAPVGFFVDVTGATGATPCPVGQTTAGPGATSVDDCFAIDTDGDGVPDAEDVCPATVLPDQPSEGLKKNRYAASIDGFASTDGIVVATLEDTGGCSGSQIIANSGLGAGHTKFGISRSALRDWIDAQNA
ncbi:MAG: hypothetical protein QNJ12_22165 [Ilumatobacter sp.]|uniref:hypothetical protein n=1 Tax=Ilumatobacter sp. TaxID=1967498 RepID=UPI002616AC4B|nr:hypothetical protein [Ilumatobacter sp.]MDJ0771507.1 hypothetical protein [Ilumatobacter sp.]